MTSKNPLLLILFLILPALNFAQTKDKKVNTSSFEGSIVYNISYPDMDLDMATQAMMPSEMTSFIKKLRHRSEMSMGMGMKSVTISNRKEKKSTTLLDLMGSKYAIITDEDDSKDIKMTFKSNDTNPSKMIAGYNCTKAEFVSNDSSNFVVYYTEELGKVEGGNSGLFKEINGILMQFTISQKGNTMTMTASKVTKETVAEDKFTVPADYKPTTTEALSKLFGGR